MSTEKEAKQKALQLTLDKLEKTYGKGTIMRLGDKPEVDVDAISTGSLGLDIALGTGGFPKGRVIEIYGIFRKDNLLYMLLLKVRKKEV